jgi:aminopeptidase N
MINFSNLNRTPYFFITCVTITLFVFSSCKTKKTDAVAAEVLLPEITVSSKPEHKVYYASYTRLSDIIHTKLDISLNWDSCFVLGKANLKVRPYFYDTEELVLDAKGFQIKEVKVNNKAAKYIYDGYKLNISLDKKYTKDENYEVYIDYISMPNKLKVKGSVAINSDKGFYFINPTGKNKNKPTQFWTQGETESNSCWFPTIESGNERFSQEISITVDTSMVTLSNGRLVYSTNNSNGTRTDYWRQDLPHAPYLTMLAGGKFSVYKDKWRNMEVNYYMEPKYAPNAKLIFGNTPEMIEFFSNKLGVSYPWDKYSQIVVRDFVSGAMENTGAVTFYDAMNKTLREYEDQTDEDIISHELTHHWFGDLVTCESWPNLTLNEGFATYGEYLWDEYKYGRDEADKDGLNNLNQYLAIAKDQRVDMIRFNLSDRETMFDANSYQKGGQIVHMLRKYVGDQAFFAAIKLYLDTYKFKPVEIHHLRLVFEEITGEDLNWFFNQWYLNQGHPELEINYAYSESTKKSTVTIEQKQDLSKNPLYKLPVDVDVYEQGAVKRKRIIIDSVSQTFEFTTDTKPMLINVDAEKMLVCTKKDNHTKEEWLYMFSNAKLFLDRYEALNAFENYKSDSLVQLAIIKALGDPFYSIKTLAISKLKLLNEKNLSTAYPIVKNLALTDKNSSVRARSVKALNDLFNKEDNTEIYAKAETDISHQVETNVFKIYTTTNKEKAWKIAKKEQDTENSSMQIAIADFYGKEGTATENDFFINAITRKTNFTLFFLMPHYKNYLKRMDDEVIRKALQPVADIAKTSNNVFVQNSVKNTLKDMKSFAKSEELKAEIQVAIDKLAN